MIVRETSCDTPRIAPRPRGAAAGRDPQGAGHGAGFASSFDPPGNEAEADEDGAERRKRGGKVRAAAGGANGQAAAIRGFDHATAGTAGERAERVAIVADAVELFRIASRDGEPV